MEGSGLSCRYGRGTFEQIFQFVIVTSIQPADGGRLLRALQLAPQYASFVRVLPSGRGGRARSPTNLLRQSRERR
jgi:hypothetical protein